MDKKFMQKAISLAKKAAANGDVPVGAVVVLNGKIIATGYNKREKNSLATAHAEVLAINAACKKLNTWHLDDCELYVTLEPCPMCAGAIINSRIKTVIFGAFDSKAGSCSNDSVVNLLSYGYNHTPEVYAGIMENDCATLLRDFFKDKR
ncbi:MAG: tRNA adenosine(34) deaminase TadA [Clostridia bacterium]|nr:tRNA adenosine(34) deaminase TadA [Clostridia bacterium]